MSTVSKNIQITLNKEEFKTACRVSLSTNSDFIVSETENGFVVKERNVDFSAIGSNSYRATATVDYAEGGAVTVYVSNFGLGPFQKNHVTQICDMIVNMVRIGEDKISRENQTSSNQSSVANTSIPEQIRQLAELKEAGILTENEFRIKKEQLLAKTEA